MLAAGGEAGTTRESGDGIRGGVRPRLSYFHAGLGETGRAGFRGSEEPVLPDGFPEARG